MQHILVLVWAQLLSPYIVFTEVGSGIETYQLIDQYSHSKLTLDSALLYLIRLVNTETYLYDTGCILVPKNQTVHYPYKVYDKYNFVTNQFYATTFQEHFDLYLKFFHRWRHRANIKILKVIQVENLKTPEWSNR